MKNLNSDQLHDAIDQALAEVSRRLESGELDGSGRFWTDEELAAGAATRGEVKPAKAKASPAA
jgi:hypothetical protein